MAFCLKSQCSPFEPDGSAPCVNVGLGLMVIGNVDYIALDHLGAVVQVLLRFEHTSVIANYLRGRCVALCARKQYIPQA